MKRRCPKCAAEWEIKGPIGFREECPECAAFLHICPNCKHYEPVRRDCRIPTTEPVHDREGVNFCEEYEFGTPVAGGAFTPRAPAPPPKAGSGKSDNGRGAEGGKISAEEARRRFEKLFRDPST